MKQLIKQAKTDIVTIVNDEPGITAVRLLLKLKEYNKDYIELNFPVLIDVLVKEQKLVEVEYTLPTMSYRAKSLFFPSGTTIKVLGQ